MGSSKEAPVVEAITLFTPEVGDRSYLVHDGTCAVAIDPQRDTDRLLKAAALAGVRITFVAETHLHNDYLSGGRALAQELAVPYLVAASEDVSFDHRPVQDGQEVVVTSRFSLRVVATPGHTPHHISYVAMDRGRPVLACTGGSMLLGSVGRTDLFGTNLAAPLAREQYRSSHRLARLPDAVEVLPTHGFGSFCSAGTTTVERSTIAEQRRANVVFHSDGEEAFVARLLGSFGDYPRYYHRMPGHNRIGAAAPDLSPPPRLDHEQIRQAAESDAWLVDLRGRGAFAACHLHRSINVEHDVPFTTYVGWLLPDDTPLVLMAESAKAVAAAQLDLSRIGLERLVGQYVDPLPAAPDGTGTGSYPVRTFADLDGALTTHGHVALDVRRQEEWDAGHLDGALHIPLHKLLLRIDDVPPGTIWVHCAAGYRAAIAASLLARHGRDVVLIDGHFPTAPG
jgi:hydroxyacylglutathione hydrolase